MAANTAAEALSQFLTSTPERGGSGALLDRLGESLLPVGDGGLDFASAMQRAGLSRPEFLSVLNAAVSSGVVEAFDDAGQRKLRLTPSGRSLY